MKRLLEVVLVISPFLIIYMYFALTEEYAYGGSDNFLHFLIAKYAFKNPELLLNHWGKPAYNLLFMLPAQWSFVAVKVLNVVLSMSTAVVIYFTSRALAIKNPWISMVLTLIMPIYFYVGASALTEILFSLLLSLALFQFSNKHYLSSAFIASFIPMARTEGFFVLFVIIFCFLLIRNYRSAILCLAGTILYSLIGLTVFGDILWLYTHMPYPNTSDVYGAGNFMHFFNKMQDITGLPIAILSIIGLTSLIVGFNSKLKFVSTRTALLAYMPYVFAIGTFGMYFSIHVVAWYTGRSGSLGLIRVMAAVTPMLAIFGNAGINFFFSLIYLNSRINKVIVLILMASLLYQFSQVVKNKSNEFPLETLVKEACDWLKENAIDDETKLFYYDPLSMVMLERDPYDLSLNHWLYWKGDPNDPLDILSNGDYLLWDAKYGPNEGKTPLDMILYAKHSELIQRFYPGRSNSVLNSSIYNIFIFRKNESIPGGHHKELLLETDLTNIDTKHEFIDLLDIDFNELDEDIILMDFELDLNSISNPSLIRLVFSIKRDGNDYFYRSFRLSEEMAHKVSNQVVLPPKFVGKGLFKVYLWNPSFEDFDLGLFKLKIWKEDLPVTSLPDKDVEE